MIKLISFVFKNRLWLNSYHIRSFTQSAPIYSQNSGPQLVKEAFDRALNRLEGYIKQEVEDATEVLNEQVSKASQTMKEEVSDLKTEVSGEIEVAIKALKTEVSNASNEMKEEVSELKTEVSNASNEMKKEVSDLKTEVSGEIEVAIKALKTEVSNASNEMKKEVSYLKTEVSGEIEGAIKALKTEVSGEIEGAIRILKIEVSTASSAMGDEVNKTLSGFENKISGIQQQSIETIKSQSLAIYNRLEKIELKTKNWLIILGLVTFVSELILTRYEYLRKKADDDIKALEKQSEDTTKLLKEAIDKSKDFSQKLELSIQEHEQIEEELQNTKQKYAEVEKRAQEDIDGTKALMRNAITTAMVKPLTLTFSDASDIDYDTAIENTKNSVKVTKDPCSAVNEIDKLLSALSLIKAEYNPRPCREGLCFGIFTPHRDRITRRENKIKEEKLYYEANCERYKKIFNIT